MMSQLFLNFLAFLLLLCSATGDSSQLHWANTPTAHQNAFLDMPISKSVIINHDLEIADTLSNYQELEDLDDEDESNKPKNACPIVVLERYCKKNHCNTCTRSVVQTKIKLFLLYRNLKVDYIPSYKACLLQAA